VRSSLAICAALLVALCLAACGGGGSGSDSTSGEATVDTTITDGEAARSPVEEEVREAAVAAVENTDRKSFCREQASKGYLREVYGGSVKKCVASEGSVPQKPGTAVAGETTLEPDEEGAEVAISVKGGSLDGTAGAVQMVKEGGAWKVDEYDDAFLRSAFQAAIEVTDKGALSVPKMKACFTKQLKTLPADTVRELTYLSNRGATERENAGLKRIAKHCPEAALAEYGATALTAEIDEKGHKPGYAKCLYREISLGLELSGITLELFGEHPDEIAVAALEGLVEGAKQNCGG
jgi:hypothetical protein